jgi:hypothetical protein
VKNQAPVTESCGTISQNNEVLRHVFHKEIFPSFHIQGISIKLTNMRYCAYFLPHYNQSEPGQQEPSLPPPSWSLQAEILKTQAAGLTETVTIYQLAQCHIPENLFVATDLLSEDVFLK